MELPRGRGSGAIHSAATVCCGNGSLGGTARLSTDGGDRTEHWCPRRESNPHLTVKSRRLDLRAAEATDV